MLSLDSVLKVKALELMKPRLVINPSTAGEVSMQTAFLLSKQTSSGQVGPVHLPGQVPQCRAEPEE